MIKNEEIDLLRFKVVTIAVLAVIIISQGATAGNCIIVPRVGYSIPTGSSAETWQSGYSLGLDLFSSEVNRICFGLRLGFHRWTPDAEELLKVGSREFKVEKNEGWETIGELSGLVSYKLADLPKGLGAIRIEGGLGVCRISQSDVYVKGYHVFENIALNRDISMNEKMEVKPGISIGLRMEIAPKIEPTIRYQYVFTSAEGTGILTFGIGLLAH